MTSIADIWLKRKAVVSEIPLALFSSIPLETLILSKYSIYNIQSFI